MLLLGSSGHRCPTVRAASPSFSSLTSSCQGLGVQGAGGRGQLRDTPAPEGLVPSALPMTRTQGAHTIPYQRCTPRTPAQPLRVPPHQPSPGHFPTVTAAARGSLGSLPAWPLPRDLRGSLSSWHSSATRSQTGRSSVLSLVGPHSPAVPFGAIK